MNKNDIILGIWDGHDSGAAFVYKDKILFAANEERFTRRKLEIKFPYNSIRSGLDTLNLSPSDIKYVAYSTTDPAKTLTRTFPFLKENYYKIRRKKVYPNIFTGFSKKFKYFFTQLNPNFLTRKISNLLIRKRLQKMDIKPEKIFVVDHHQSHIFAAGLCSRFNKCLVITLDGIGDGLSGIVSSFKGGKFTTLHKQSGRHSVGIFFEHVTNLLNMRELEDEGKVMALADFSLPLDKNPLKKLFKVKKGKIICKYSSLKLYRELEKVLWKYPLEQFAYLAQNTLEDVVLKYISYWLDETNFKKIALAGGVFANIKLNQKILQNKKVKDIFVFPHMGDGGLAIGSAIYASKKISALESVVFKNCFLGPTRSKSQIKNSLKFSEFKYEKVDPVKTAAKLIADGEIIFWYQDEMEYGPRALGHRSILCLPNDRKLKDKLNLSVKKRVWYQPFCPSMLLADAKEIFTNLKGSPNEHMTCGYMVKSSRKKDMIAVINVDNSCRPQIVTKDTGKYFHLLKELKRQTGLGVVLNTSFNIHGQPIVNTEKEALEVLRETKDVKYLIINKLLIQKKNA